MLSPNTILCDAIVDLEKQSTRSTIEIRFLRDFLLNALLHTYCIEIPIADRKGVLVWELLEQRLRKDF